MVGNFPGVRRELTEGIKSLPGWRKRVHQKKTETRQKIIEGNRKACRENGPRIKLRHRAKDWTMSRELVGSSLGDSLKGSGSSLETCREITKGRP
ncbi:hypothetical protein BHM03_00015411 [Ensete ventricosum]|nr:hypothetical protein BHM03_00015411 [Ensete ventricosum]